MALIFLVQGIVVTGQTAMLVMAIIKTALISITTWVKIRFGWPLSLVVTLPLLILG